MNRQMRSPPLSYVRTFELPILMHSNKFLQHRIPKNVGIPHNAKIGIYLLLNMITLPFIALKIL